MPAPSAPQSACAAQPLEHTDAGPYGEGTRRSDTYPNGTHAGSPEACCALCAADENCVAWTAATSGEAEIDCWPFSVAQSTQSKAGRTFGRVKASLSAVKVARAGSVVYDGANTGNASTVQPPCGTSIPITTPNFRYSISTSCRNSDWIRKGISFTVPANGLTNLLPRYTQLSFGPVTQATAMPVSLSRGGTGRISSTLGSRPPMPNET